MLRKIDHLNLGSSNLGRLQSKFHFSFAQYYNPQNIHFGVLRVINDDTIAPKSGFGTHPHEDMEIITYVINGTLTHKDSMGNERSLGRGDVQYLSAGVGITHSEYNNSDEVLRLLQIWIFPDKKGHKPNYGDQKFDSSLRHNKLLPIVSSKANGSSLAPIRINQDANFYVSELDKGVSVEFKVAKNRQAYLVLIEGKALINEFELAEQDGLESTEESLKITALEKSHFLVIEMKKG
ncbi:pirin family protein [Campylobacter geochelonis]|uniref:pirin family protein n=1 Tax=Campylobacter geochelonis TaxID=1780362 RepID=UPI00077074B7|nr:pirin family protein [Campylobacter geochelonis]CZE46390.1 pirin family protein [Campylobacter geochelonis]